MTTHPAIRAALVTLLETTFATWDPIVQVVDGSPVGVTTLGPDLLIIGAMRGVRSAGSQNRIRTTTRNIPFGTSQDEYTVDLIISVSRAMPGETTDVMQRADDIFEAARDAIEATDDLDVTGVYEALPTGDFEFDPISDSNGRYVTVSWGLDVTARD